jgi:hypothetical protein
MLLAITSHGTGRVSAAAALAHRSRSGRASIVATVAAAAVAMVAGRWWCVDGRALIVAGCVRVASMAVHRAASRSSGGPQNSSRNGAATKKGLTFQRPQRLCACKRQALFSILTPASCTLTSGSCVLVSGLHAVATAPCDFLP